MQKVMVLIPLVTDKNEICLNGDIVYLEDDKVFFERSFLGRHEITAKDFNKYFEIQKEWKN